MSGPLLIAGVGNVFLGDDAFGCEVVRRLRLRTGSEAASDVRDFGVRTRELAYVLAESRAGTTVIVDAAASGAAPGTLQLFDLARDGAPPAHAGVHGIDLPGALALARSLGTRLERSYLLGCEPACLAPAFDAARPLSPRVERAAQSCVDLLARLIAEPQTDLVALCTS